MKKILKLIFSRSFYFFAGIVLAISVYVVQAAWNTPVTDGTPLTPVLWNDLVAKIAELDAKTANSDITFINPVVIGTGSAAVGWTNFDAAPHIPTNASAVILEAEIAMSGPDGGDVDAHIRIRKDAVSQSYVLARGRAASSGDNAAWSTQGIFPISTAKGFQYAVEAPGFGGGYTVRLIGYMR